MSGGGPSVTDEARALVGTVTRQGVSDPVSVRQVREYIAGTGGDPATFSPVDGNGEPVPVPPLFFHAACRQVVSEQDLLADGQYSFLGVTGVSGVSLAAGNTYEMLAPVFVGDVLTWAEELESIAEREGRKGPLVFTTTLTRYANQEGVEVATYRQVIAFT
jgi:hydroxyacyl-ACP dehydratase HTD2-like protein with hotdog domain